MASNSLQNMGNVMPRLHFILLVLLLLVSNKAEAEVYSDPLGLYSTVWGQISAPKDICPYLTYSVALIEARRIWKDGMVRPWPWAITRNDGPKIKSHFPKTRMEAETILRQILKETKNVDVGIMQINLHHHGHRVKDPIALLDLEENIKVGVDILSEAIKSSPGDLERGVGRYHSWRSERGRIYGRKVLALRDIIAKGGY